MIAVTGAGDTTTAMTTSLTATMDAEAGAVEASAHLLRLLAWLSPSFPTGGFGHSQGLEYVVEAGLVRDRAGCVAASPSCSPT